VLCARRASARPMEPPTRLANEEERVCVAEVGPGDTFPAGGGDNGESEGRLDIEDAELAGDEEPRLGRGEVRGPGDTLGLDKPTVCKSSG
jgi:hypothetical protein